MADRYCDLGGAALAVASTVPALIDFLADVLNGEGADTPMAPVCFRLMLATGQPVEPPPGGDRPCRWSGA